MQPASLLIIALSLLSTALAFIPWFPAYLCLKDGTCKAQRSVTSGLSAAASHDNGEVLRLKLVKRRTKSIIPSLPNFQPETRDGLLHDLLDLNTVLHPRATITAQTPTQTNSAGIAQDGGDNQYFAEVRFGSNQTPLLMLLDSGASDTWVKANTCTSAACSNHKTFGADNSTTIQTKTDQFSITYGSGNVNGTYATDSISFAGLNFRMQFGLARFVSDTFLSFSFDGILGMSVSAGPNFINTLVASKLLKSNIFGMSFSSIDDGPNTSEISFGAPNPSKFTGNLVYAPTLADKKGYWTAKLDDIGFGDKQLGKLTKSVVYIDTGTTYIFAPEPDATAFYATVPGAVVSSNHASDHAWTVPCDTTTPLTFTITGVTYSVPAKDWVGPMANGVCTSNLYWLDLDGWLLGDMFLKQVYTVFDVDASRIGFAPAKIASVDSTSTSASSIAGSLPTSTGTVTTQSPVSSVSTGTTDPNQPTNLSSPASNTSPTGIPSPLQTLGTMNGHQTSILQATPVIASASNTSPSVSTTTSKSSGATTKYRSAGLVIASILVIIVS